MLLYGLCIPRTESASLELKVTLLNLEFIYRRPLHLPGRKTRRNYHIPNCKRTELFETFGLDSFDLGLTAHDQEFEISHTSNK